MLKRASIHRMLYVLAYPDFQPDVALQIDRFRSVHKPERAKLVPPHITLAFGLRHADQRDVLSIGEAVADGFSEFDVEFADCERVYDTFEKSYKLVLLCGKGRETLIGLHNRLHAGPLRAELRADMSYRPHLTVATRSDHAAIAGLDAADIGDFPIKGTVRSLEVVALAEGRLTTVKSLAFSK